MKPIHLFPLVNVPVVNGSEAAEPGQSHPQVLHKLEHLAASLARTFRTPCRIRPETFDVTFSLDANRHQCYSTSILQRMARAGVHCFLIGEALMRQGDVAAATRTLLGATEAARA